MSEGDEEQAPARRRRFTLDRSLLAALTSGFVGALALAISTYNVYLQHEQIRAQVWPRLVWDHDWEMSGTLSFELHNRGVGSAEVKRARVLVDGQPTRDWTDALSRLLHRTSFKLPDITGFEDAVLTPGFDLVAVKLTDAADARSLVAERRRLAVQICYCSTLDDCWQLDATTMGANTTHAVADCAADAVPFQSLPDGVLDDVLKKLAEGVDAGTRGDAGRAANGD